MVNAIKKIRHRRFKALRFLNSHIPYSRRQVAVATAAQASKPGSQLCW